MLDKKELEESRILISHLIKEGKIIKAESERKDFFLKKSDESLLVAKRLELISQDKTNPLKSYMWIITTAYYSMFFAATALLAHYNHKINSEIGIHKVTYHALMYYFHILDQKLQKHFIDTYKESYNNSNELLQISEAKALEMLENFKFEQTKRKMFTYEMGYSAEEIKAKTSLRRAQDFVEEVKKIME